MDPRQNISKQDGIDFNSFLSYIIKYWYLFTICIPLFLVIGFLYLRYTDPVYNSSATILIRDKNNQKVGAENLIEGLELFSSKKNLENEIEVIRSHSMISKAFKSLDFGVSYFAKGQIVTNEMYNESPFQVIVDSVHTQITARYFYIKILTDSTFNLSINANNFQPYIPYYNQVLSEKITSYHFSQNYKFGDTCNTQYFGLVVKRTPEKNLKVWKDTETLLFFSLNKLEDLTDLYSDKLRVEPVNDKSSIVRVSLNGNVIQKDIDFINALCEQYISSDLEEKNKIASNTIKFIDDQLEEVSKTLVGAEAQLEKYRASNNIMDLEFASSSIFEQLTALDKEKAELLVKNKYYHYLLNYVTTSDELNNIIAPSSLGIDDPLLVSLIDNLNKLNSEKAALHFGVQITNPTVNVINLKIKNAKESLIENLKNIINSSNIGINDINERINKLNGLVKKLPKTERDLVNIQRLFNLNDHIYNYLLEKRAEAGIAKAANTPDNKILDTARLISKKPITPKKNLINTFAIVLGILFPILFIIIKLLLNNKIQSKEQLIQLSNIPLLGVIGHNNKRNSLPLLESPKSSISESFRSLRINFQYLNSGHKSKVIGITSSVSGEGKTFCSLNLASAIALAGTKTILLGADLRKPKLGKELNLDIESGLSSFLIGKNSVEEIIHSHSIENLDIIVSGPIPPNPVELLGSHRTKELFNYLKNKYDIILIDSPPIGLVADYFVLKEFVDAHIYIVRNNYTKIYALENVNELYERKELNNLFLVLNDTKPEGLNRYGYYYQYGYGYYEDDRKDTLVDKIRNLISFKKTKDS